MPQSGLSKAKSRQHSARLWRPGKRRAKVAQTINKKIAEMVQQLDQQLADFEAGGPATTSHQAQSLLMSIQLAQVLGMMAITSELEKVHSMLALMAGEY